MSDSDPDSELIGFGICLPSVNDTLASMTQVLLKIAYASSLSCFFSDNLRDPPTTGDHNYTGHFFWEAPL